MCFQISMPCLEFSRQCLPRLSRSPCLAYFEEERLSWKFYQYNDSFNMPLSDCTNAEIRCSNSGWLLMQRVNRSIFFYDPFNNRRIDVPTKDRPYFFPYFTMHFFHPPTSPDCFILWIKDFRRGREQDIWVGILKHGSCEWEESQYQMETPYWRFKSTPVLRSRLLYFLCHNDVVVFDVEKHKRDSAWTVHRMCLRKQNLQVAIQKSFLLRIEDGDAIFAVFVMFSVGEASVYKLLEPEMEWELVNDLGDKVLYVSRLSSFGVKAPVKSMMGNTINFAQLYDGSPVFYSLEDQKYHSFGGGNYFINSPFDSSDYINCGGYLENSPHKRLDLAAWISPLPRRNDMVPRQWSL